MESESRQERKHSKLKTLLYLVGATVSPIAAVKFFELYYKLSQASAKDSIENFYKGGSLFASMACVWFSLWSGVELYRRYKERKADGGQA